VNQIRHIGEWDGSRWRAMCEVWAGFVPERRRGRVQRSTTNGGHCLACEACARVVT